MIVLDASLTPLAVTSAAQRWLAEIDDGHDASRALPWAALTLAARAVGGDHEPRFARVRTRAGRWISLYAERLATDPVQVTMIIHPCRPTEVAQVIGDAYQLTPRERDIVRLLSTGHSRGDIARLLVVSSHTVDDHIKRVYSKLGVRSRPELTAKIFFDQHVPRIHHDVAVGGTGWLFIAPTSDTRRRRHRCGRIGALTRPGTGDTSPAACAGAGVVTRRFRSSRGHWLSPGPG